MVRGPSELLESAQHQWVLCAAETTPARDRDRTLKHCGRSNKDRRAFSVWPGSALSSSRRVSTLNTETGQEPEPLHDARGPWEGQHGRRLTFPIAAPALGCAGSLARPQNGPTGRSETSRAGLQEPRLLFDTERREESTSFLLLFLLPVLLSSLVVPF